MKPALFADLSKKSNDLLTKEYSNDFKVEVETKTSNGVTFIGNSKQARNGDVLGELRAKYKDSPSGLTLDGSLFTNDKIKGKASIEDKLLDGLKVTLEGATAPKSAKVELQYKTDYLSTTAHADFYNGPTVGATATVGYQGVAVGTSIVYDTDKNDMAKNDFGASYTDPEFVVNAFCKNKCDVLGASFFHQINKETQVGGEFVHKREKKDNSFALGTRVDLDAQSFFKARIDSAGKLGLCYSHELNKSVTMTLSGEVDTANLEKGRVGLKLALFK